MHIKIMDINDAQALLTFYLNNREHLEVWEPAKSDQFYTLDYWQSLIKQRHTDMANGFSVYFIALDDHGNIMAYCNLTNIMRGVFQACFMGYAVAKAYEGQGVMTALCQHATVYAFERLKLNRIMANYLPHNRRSAQLLSRLGFAEEGYAKRYLKIHGEWQDHVLTALVNPQSV